MKWQTVPLQICGYVMLILVVGLLYFTKTTT